MRRGGLLVWAGAMVALSAACTEAEPSGAGATAGPSATAGSSSPSATAGSSGPSATAGSSGPSATARPCQPTPGAEEGPAAAPPDTPFRVRLGPGGDVPATAETVATSRKGTALQVTGVVYAEDCRTPLAGATVDAWQTTADGRYAPSGSGAAGGCCYLQGEVRSDSQGRYVFDTVVPGRYAEPNPPARHIHLAISHPQARSLTTELIFAGDPGVRADDPLAVTPTARGASQHVQFDIVLRRR